MQAHFAAGERGQALETYEACQAVLESELGIEPEPDTAALAERIRTQAPPVHHIASRTASRRHLPDTSVAFLGNLFTGRNSEYQALINRFELAAAGQPQLVVLRGEAGIGKTRLARKFLGWASAQGAELLQGGAFESGSHLPFQPLVEALRLRFERENSPKDLLDDGWLSPLRQLLPELNQLFPETTVAQNQPDVLVAVLLKKGMQARCSSSNLLCNARWPWLNGLRWCCSWMIFSGRIVRRWRCCNTPSGAGKIVHESCCWSACAQMLCTQ